MDPNTHILGVKGVGPQAKIVPTSNSEVSLLRPLWTMNSNLMFLPPFIIHMMRHWIGQAAVIWLYGSKLTHSWCESERGGTSSQNRPHQQLGSQLVETIVDNEFQSHDHDSPTIHYTYDEILDQSSCCDMAVWIQTHTFLV